jgi:hypothetical protein
MAIPRACGRAQLQEERLAPAAMDHREPNIFSKIGDGDGAARLPLFLESLPNIHLERVH